MMFQYRDSALSAYRVGIPRLPCTLALMKTKKLIVGYIGLCAPGPVSVVDLPLITATWVHTLTSVSPWFAQVESHHHNDLMWKPLKQQQRLKTEERIL